MEIELVVHCVILERTRPELIFLGRRRAVRWKLKATLDTPVDGRERDFVPIERGTPLVEKHTPRRELRLAHSLLLFPPLDASFDGVDSASDGFLNEVCVVPCRFPLRATRSLRSLLEVGGSTSKMLKQLADIIGISLNFEGIHHPVYLSRR